MHDGRDVGTAEKLDQGLLCCDFRLGQDVQVTDLAFFSGNRVVVGHAEKLRGDIQPTALTALDDRPDLLIAESDVGTVAAAVVDVIDHVRRLRAGRNMNEQAAPAWPGRIGDLVAADHQRWADFVARNLVHAISELGQFDPTHLVGPAVMILHSDNQEATVDSKGRQVLRQLGVMCSFAGRELLLEVHPM
jgi:hypothetical protein